MSDQNKTEKKPVVKKAVQALISLVAMVLLTLVVYWFDIPNPNMILITGLVVLTAIYGYPAGIICSVDMIVYSLFFFSTDHDFIHFTSQNLQKMAVIIFGVIVSAVFIGQLKHRRNEATKKLFEINEILKYDNALLKEASTTDTLTGVKNRFAFRRDYSERFTNGSRVHVMMADIDNFKKINDEYGHAAGDEALRSVGVILKNHFGEESCYRYGGDEFLISCTDISESDFTGVLDKVKQDIGELSENRQNRYRLMISAGYVYGIIDHPDDLRLMLRQADANLYEAKNAGKGCYIGSEYSRSQAETLSDRQ